MKNSFQSLETLESAGYGSTAIPDPVPWYSRRRFRIFIIIFLLISICGLIYSFSKPPVFRSSASLTLVPDSESDRYWATVASTTPEPDAEHRHIAVQERILTDPELLHKLWSALRNDSLIPTDAIADFNTLGNMLSVVSIAESNLVELRAEGPVPAILPVLVDCWIENYRAIRSGHIDQSTSTTHAALTDQLETLKIEINNKKRAIEAFRQGHGILSEVRDENPNLTKLTGINQTLNLANEEAVKARSKLESVRAAIARGEPVFLDNSNNRENLAELEKSAQVLREKLANLKEQYTDDYIRLVPNLRAVPEQLKAVEAKIASMGRVDQDRVVSITRQEADAAEQQVRSVQQQLDEYRKTASEFTARFSEYEEQLTALHNLEDHSRSTEDKILQTEVRQHWKYPDIEVISKAFLPQQPIGPDYLREAGITIAAALLFALLGVWISNFLLRESIPGSTAITLSGIHMYPDGNRTGLPPPGQTPQLNTLPSGVASLAPPIPDELTDRELQNLLHRAPLKGRQLIAVLLSGVTVEEAAMLDPEHFDPARDRIEIGADQPRFIPMSAELKALFGESFNLPAWRLASHTHAEDLRELLACVATDADLPDSRVSPESLRHTYLMYLVRQGIRLTDLAEIAGYISSSMMAVYRGQSPRGGAKHMHEIDLVHPSMRSFPVEPG